MVEKGLLLFILLISSLIGFSQNPSQDSIATKRNTITPSLPFDSTFVTYNSYQFDSIFMNASKVVDTMTSHVAKLDILNQNKTIFSTLSNVGLAHKPMRFNYLHQVGFDMSLPAFSTYLQNEGNLIAHQSILPYSELNYLMTATDKEQHLNAKFGRQFSPNLFVSFEFNTDYAPETFIHNKTINNYFWVNAHYFTKNNRYGIVAYWYRNKLEMQENGGLVNDEAFSSHSETDNMVIATNLNSATNFVISSGIGFEHYFNLLSEKTKTTTAIDSFQTIVNDSLLLDNLLVDSLLIDSLLIDSTFAHDENVVTETKTRKFTLGRICHSFSYLNNKIYYNESSPNVAFYQPYDTLYNLSKTTDTTLVRAIRNSLKWNSLGYKKYYDDIPFYVYAGITHGLYSVKHFDYLEDETVLQRNYNQLSIHGGIIVNLFKSTRITGQGELITLGYQIGDFDLKGQWKQFLGTSSKNLGQTVFDFELKRQSATWFEERYDSNHFRWENDFKASTYLTFNVRYNYQNYCIGVKQTTISNLIYFGYDAYPTQNEGMFSIREAYLSFYQKLWRFEFEGFASLQKSSNEDIEHLPLFQAKMKIGYAQPIFHKAATLYPSLTVSYFTRYYADAYMPATRTFHLQNEVEIGNFPFIDLAVAIKIKKAHIFVAYSNMFQLTGNYNSFIAPHYPMHDSKIYIGINWRLFN